MHILITGAAGMIGRKLTDRLAAAGGINGEPIERLTLLDVVPAPKPEQFTGQVRNEVDSIAADLSAPGEAARVLARRPRADLSISPASSPARPSSISKRAIASISMERAPCWKRSAPPATATGPKLVYTSSIAVFGAPFPPAIPDDFHLTPLTSYGTQKAIGELLLADYTRRGFCDGVGIRLPSVVVRPGKPNRAASGFFSGIIREPLAGLEAMLPVPDTVVHTHASPRAAVGFLLHAAGLARDALGARINLSMPGVCCTVAEQIAVAAARSPATAWRRASAASTTRWLRALSRAGRSASKRGGRANSVLSRKARSTRSCASISTRTAAAALCRKPTLHAFPGSACLLQRWCGATSAFLPTWSFPPARR